MNEPLKVEIRFLLTTPAFLGNSRQEAELRPQSFKGLLRHWYRAVDARLTDKRGGKREDLLWGGTTKGMGQSSVLLRIVPPKKTILYRWRREEFSRFTSGSGKNTINGAWYLGYPFAMKGNRNRTALAPGTLFTLQGVVPRAPAMEKDQVRGVLASFWLLAMLGSCGSRSRRGFGSLQAVEWGLAGREVARWQDLFSRLPDPSRLNTPSDWQEGLRQGREVFADWFGRFPDRSDSSDSTKRKSACHPHLGKRFEIVLMDPATDWQTALARAGEAMQRFRQRRPPDYTRMKDFLASPRDGRKAPERASFGLPLTFRYSHYPKGPVELFPQRPHSAARLPDRFASLLGIKIIRLGQRFCPLVYRMDGAVPGTDLAIRARLKGRQYTLLNATESAMDKFFDQLQGRRP